MEIRSGTTATVSGVAGAGTFGQPFPNGIDFLILFWLSNSNPTNPPQQLGVQSSSASGYSYAATGPGDGEISYLAVGH